MTWRARGRRKRPTAAALLLPGRGGRVRACVRTSPSPRPFLSPRSLPVLTTSDRVRPQARLRRSSTSTGKDPGRGLATCLLVPTGLGNPGVVTRLVVFNCSEYERHRWYPLHACHREVI